MSTNLRSSTTFKPNLSHQYGSFGSKAQTPLPASGKERGEMAVSQATSRLIKMLFVDKEIIICSR